MTNADIIRGNLQELPEQDLLSLCMDLDFAAHIRANPITCLCEYNEDEKKKIINKWLNEEAS